ncbi:hypothetical protein [Pseudomonas mosselii]|uniref:hypothetical protein n=1 Tax=Pseudomonas mosselii TaxID=78327 RepID=UPI0026327C11|nr:hypothetical protein [Pseudomonas mosselii]MDN4496645.1 hypothetical protein [Pseudomonas mosselii]
MKGFELLSKVRFARFPVLAALLLAQFICIAGGVATYCDVSWFLAAPVGVLYFIIVRKHMFNCLVAVAGAHFGLGIEWSIVVALLFGLYALLHIISAVASSVQEFAM